MSEQVYAKRGTLCRLIYLVISIFWYLITLGGRLYKKNSVILCYHGIHPEQKQRFERQMIGLGGRNLFVYITFDDAFENLLTNVLPILEDHQIPAIVFAVAGNLGRVPAWNIAADHPDCKEKTMTAQQLKKIQNELIKIGSHTQTHPDLSQLLPNQIRIELTESRRNLEQLLVKPVEDLALPHGSFNEEVLHIAQEAGYKRIYTLEPKLVKKKQKIGVIGRFSMSPDVWLIEFWLTCAGAYAWLLPWRRLLVVIRTQLKRDKHV